MTVSSVTWLSEERVFRRIDLNIFISEKETFRFRHRSGIKNTPSCFMTSRTRPSEARDTRIPPAGRPIVTQNPQYPERRSSPPGRSSLWWAPPTPVPGALLASLPPAISVSPRDLSREAGVSLSGTDWSNLNDRKKFSESLLVLRPQSGRGKAERQGSRRKARSAPARSRGRQAEDFAREPTVVAPPPRGFLSR